MRSAIEDWWGSVLRFRDRADEQTAPPPKTLITPALSSRPLHTPHTGRRGRKAKTPQWTPLPVRGVGRGRERGRGEGLGRGRQATLRHPELRQNRQMVARHAGHLQPAGVDGDELDRSAVINAVEATLGGEGGIGG